MEIKQKLERPVNEPLALMASSMNHHDSHSSSINKAKYVSPSEFEDEEPIESETPNSSEAIIELLNTMTLLGKQIQKSYYKKPTNNNLHTTPAPNATNKRQVFKPKNEVKH